MRHVQTNAELEAFHAGGEGLVFNHFTCGPAGARDNVLHTAGCPQGGKMLIRARPESRPSVRKVMFATAEEARSWLIANLGLEGRGWKSCTRCQPGGAAERTPPPARPRAVPGMAGAGAPSSVARGAGPGSWPTDAAFAMPGSPPLRLPVPPRLASWNRVGDPDQVRLAGYLDAAEALLRPSLEQLSGPLALRLDVGLPSSASLLNQRDLDNYLLPLATRLSRAGAGTLACVWGTISMPTTPWSGSTAPLPRRLPRHQAAVTPSAPQHRGSQTRSRSRSGSSSAALAPSRPGQCECSCASPSDWPGTG